MTTPPGMLIGVDVGGTTTSGGLVTAGGEILRVARTPTHRDGPGTAVDSLLRVIDDLLAHVAERHIQVDGIGIGLPGIVDSDAGTMPHGIAHLPELGGFPLAGQIQGRSGRPVFLDNDVNALALAEWTWGLGRGSASMVVLALGSGAGGGVILDGRLLRGRSGHGGEFGHVTVKLDGRPCVCGGRGCLGVYAAGYGIAMEAARRRRAAGGGAPAVDPGPIHLQPRDAEVVFRAASAGDAVAASVVEEAVQALGAALGGIVNGLNPEVLVITGGVVKSLVFFEQKILAAAARYALGPALSGTRIHFVPGDKSQTVRGGAALVLYERSRSPALR